MASLDGTSNTLGFVIQIEIWKPGVAFNLAFKARVSQLTSEGDESDRIAGSLWVPVGDGSSQRPAAAEGRL